MKRQSLVTAVLLTAFLVPATGWAQGIVGGAENGAATGRHEAGPVGGVVGGVVGGAVGGVVGGVRGVLGLPHRRHLPGYHHRRYHRLHR